MTILGIPWIGTTRRFGFGRHGFVVGIGIGIGGTDVGIGTSARIEFIVMRGDDLTIRTHWFVFLERCGDSILFGFGRMGGFLAVLLDR